ncbi:MAG: 5-(carboxyamino)imidazole ribonucleotide synthase [Myxococcota bacterium]|nr:5-(carboxyamino)imidazole ribonucleotide synthase [Myxococcota bacterium]MDW8362876.1 5-(carboxyamino)imidazole ribonucleotide synthase [Myxococcales bacterium]
MTGRASGPLLPGATLGILGGGQLARMMALEARRMGYRVRVLDPDPHGPAASVADGCVAGAFDDAEAAIRLATTVDVVTLDTEHVPAEVLERVQCIVPLRPSASVLRTVQDRLEQRRFLDRLGVPQTPWAPVDDAASLHAAAAAVGTPLVLKTRRAGYDGKGQAFASDPSQLLEAWDRIGRAPAVAERFVRFEREVSVLLARHPDGALAFYPLVENAHRRHILHASRVPAVVPAGIEEQARRIAARIAEALDHVGVMAVEMFLTREGGLLVNEIAPRTHNSGHYTLGACATSQFEQHVRAVCGLPLGDPALLSPAIMLNLLGELWRDGPPDWTAVLRHPRARLHLYGKRDARPGRKMGHVLVIDDDRDRAEHTVREIERALGIEPTDEPRSASPSERVAPGPSRNH